ncbi:MAG TPA: hypothetical protein PKL65_04900 [Bacteroidales bacterium]|nr:hypothetical protein [Bacteroidales bacterium]HNR41549.1 hypothetical protein [Bacteroidales bacterium]HPM18125.1 hypothetical protein [Bacteroidales bacterium]
MKKFIFLSVLISFYLSLPLHSQSLLNKIKKDVTKEITGKSGNDDSKVAPEPSCSCDNAKLIIDLKKYNLDYRELYLTIGIDGSIVIKDRQTQKFYILKNGQTTGPLNENDPRLIAAGNTSNSNYNDDKEDYYVKAYPGIIVKSGDKYLIKHNGKSYGPYAIISDFALSRSKNKFAAFVTETVLMGESDFKKLEEAMANAKTDQEMMEIGMKMGMQMQNQMMQSGGPESLQSKFVTNIPVSSYDDKKMVPGRLNGTAKYDDIVIQTFDKIFDLKGNPILTLNGDHYDNDDLFISSTNNKYAYYSSGTLSFNDNTKLSGLFNPYMTSIDGKPSLTYMYHSPGKDAIMQCTIPF